MIINDSTYPFPGNGPASDQIVYWHRDRRHIDMNTCEWPTPSRLHSTAGTCRPSDLCSRFLLSEIQSA